MPIISITRTVRLVTYRNPVQGEKIGSLNIAVVMDYRFKTDAVEQLLREQDIGLTMESDCLSW